MHSILVTGANRGIGLEFCKQYAQSGNTIYACCRNPANAIELLKLGEAYPCIRIKKLDVANEGSILELVSDLAGAAIDVLIHNAGVYGDNRGLGYLNYQSWLDVFTVNTIAPVRITESLLANLIAGDKKLVVAITSKMGSIADNSSGGALLYRSSKTALNAVMKSLSQDLVEQGVGILILHPGWVHTEMGGPNALITTQESVQGMLRLVNKFTLQDSGLFLDYSGKEIPW